MFCFIWRKIDVQGVFMGGPPLHQSPASLLPSFPARNALELCGTALSNHYCVSWRQSQHYRKQLANDRITCLSVLVKEMYRNTAIQWLLIATFWNTSQLSRSSFSLTVSVSVSVCQCISVHLDIGMSVSLMKVRSVTVPRGTSARTTHIKGHNSRNKAQLDITQKEYRII